jgi:hypothetical protein
VRVSRIRISFAPPELENARMHSKPSFFPPPFLLFLPPPPPSIPAQNTQRSNTQHSFPSLTHPPKVPQRKPSPLINQTAAKTQIPARLNPEHIIIIISANYSIPLWPYLVSLQSTPSAVCIQLLDIHRASTGHNHPLPPATPQPREEGGRGEDMRERVRKSMKRRERERGRGR